MTGDVVQRIVNAWATQEGQGPKYVNPGNLRDCPWFSLLVVDGKPAPPWAPGVPRRIYPGGEVVQMVKRFRVINAQPASFIGWFWMPRTRAEGIAGMRHVLELHIAEGSTLAAFIEWIAPPTENDTKTYLANVAKWAGIADPYQRLWELLPDVTDARVTT